MVKRFVLLLFALGALGAIARADVYRWVDDEGNVIFSDAPRAGAEKIELKPTTIIPGRPVDATVEEGAFDSVPEPRPYSKVTVVAPAADETLRDQQTVAVDVSTEPALQVDFGHKIQLFVDGAAFGAPTAAGHFSLPTVERGTHQLAAAVVDASGAELARSTTSVFHLHKTSIANRKTGKPTKPKPSK
jgi:hypothetical protein